MSPSESITSLRAACIDADSYLNPNAFCPVCGDRVFFYESPHGGRVFFDDVGWPWPKHPCTDSRSLQSNANVSATSIVRNDKEFKDSKNRIMDIWSIVSSEGSVVFLRLSLLERRDLARAEMEIGRTFMAKNLIKEADLFNAPSFVSRRQVARSPEREVGFICGSKGDIFHMNVKFRIIVKGWSRRH